MVWGLAKLDEDKLKAIQREEGKIGVNLLAFLDYDVKIAKLSEKDLKKVKDLEEKLGVSLVAVEK
ncbi:hypothetical protein AKJ43_02510 [candidate division MSBL1 archaeon SCGC-AAA261D19]|uniref:Uncharacterized protein n=1 Tax=candidate division MSBL1 archaeon SCGC-AAA261D19 TaxID=1698273 RepID=A0A133V6M4_9EURY|nr:hypothetical protein AKJ43_02510 [candidate division MSBL1 archaeon SCGC-AAA261D19]